MLVCRLPNFLSAQFKRMMSAAVAATAVPTKALCDSHGPLPVVCEFRCLGLQSRWLACALRADCCGRARVQSAALAGLASPHLLKN